jgi:hypothetical protein
MVDFFSKADNDQSDLTNRGVSRRRILTIGAAASVVAAVAVTTPIPGAASVASRSRTTTGAFGIPDRQNAPAYYFC